MNDLLCDIFFRVTFDVLKEKIFFFVKVESGLVSCVLKDKRNCFFDCLLRKLCLLKELHPLNSLN